MQVLHRGCWGRGYQLITIKTILLQNVAQRIGLVGSHEHSNEPSDSIKGGEFLD